jgi:hypothetical protein
MEIQMDMINRRGLSIAVELFNTGNFAPLKRVISDCNSTDPKRKSVGRVAFGAALVSLSRMLDDTRRCGITFTGNQPPSVDEVMYAYEVGGKELNDVAQLLVNATYGVRRGSPGLKASMRAEAEPTPPAPPAPMPVEVVAMPSRKTVTSVDRNMAGEITGSMQLETDI